MHEIVAPTHRGHGSLHCELHPPRLWVLPFTDWKMGRLARFPERSIFARFISPDSIGLRIPFALDMESCLQLAKR
jgi:hypothetical protein